MLRRKAYKEGGNLTKTSEDNEFQSLTVRAINENFSLSLITLTGAIL